MLGRFGMPWFEVCVLQNRRLQTPPWPHLQARHATTRRMPLLITTMLVETTLRAVGESRESLVSFPEPIFLAAPDQAPRGPDVSARGT